MSYAMYVYYLYVWSWVITAKWSKETISCNDLAHNHVLRFVKIKPMAVHVMVIH